MSSAIEKTLSRVHGRIQSGEFYEAHQAVRTVAARYLRQRDYASGIGLLYHSALLLAKARQTGSASDLLLYMIKVYEDAHVVASGPSRGRIAEVAWHLDCKDAVIKQVAQKALAWAPNDADLAHVFGVIFLRASDIYEAERYLLQGGKDSAQLLGTAEGQWAAAERDIAVQSLILSRGVLGYLSTQNIRNAHVYLAAFAEQAPISGPVADFLRLLITTCQTKNAQLYRQLKAHYNAQQTVPGWQPALQHIEQDFFGIAPQRQMNLMDMMGGFMR